MLACASVLACGSTEDVLGLDRAELPGPGTPTSLLPLQGPASYPNLFRELLGKQEAEITNRLEQAYQRLFYGNPSTQSIYRVEGEGAYILDILHGDIRTEGIGLAMLISLELDHREEFDRLWTYARGTLAYGAGPRAGYFASNCPSGPCADPYGHQQLTLALVLAHGRWGSRTGRWDYEADALRLLAVMWNKEAENGGVVDGVTNVFDAAAYLPFDVPEARAAGTTRPSVVMPAHYRLWAQATGDPRWSEAASAGRRHLEVATHPGTGLIPLRAYFDGRVLEGSTIYDSEGYRASLNLTLYHVLFGDWPWVAGECDRLLAFFRAAGPGYGSEFPYSGGSCTKCLASRALIAMNGVAALPATSAERTAFVRAAWDNVPEDGVNRYYDGLLHLTSLLVLSGRFRVF